MLNYVNNFSVSALFRCVLWLDAMSLHVGVEVLLYPLRELLHVVVAYFQVLIKLIDQAEVRKSSVPQPLVHKREILVCITADIDHANTAGIFLKFSACIDELFREIFHFVPHIPLCHCVCWRRIWDHYQQQPIPLLVLVGLHKLCELAQDRRELELL